MRSSEGKPPRGGAEARPPLHDGGHRQGLAGPLRQVAMASSRRRPVWSPRTTQWYRGGLQDPGGGPAADPRLRWRWLHIRRSLARPVILRLSACPSKGQPPRTLGGERPDTLTSVNNLASLLHAQGKLGKAEPLFRPPSRPGRGRWAASTQIVKRCKQPPHSMMEL
eukprot:8831154-Heterocapsa_arctica.AAC.1